MYAIRKCPKCGRLMTGRIEYQNGAPIVVHSCDFCNYKPHWKISYSDRTEREDVLQQTRKG